MRLKKLTEDDEQFGHKAGDIFIVEDADYDSDKCIGVKVQIVGLGNSFYKEQLKNATMPDLLRAGESVFSSTELDA